MIHIIRDDRARTAVEWHFVLCRNRFIVRSKHHTPLSPSLPLPPFRVPPLMGRTKKKRLPPSPPSIYQPSPHHPPPPTPSTHHRPPHETDTCGSPTNYGGVYVVVTKSSEPDMVSKHRGENLVFGHMGGYNYYLTTLLSRVITPLHSQSNSQCTVIIGCSPHNQRGFFMGALAKCRHSPSNIKNKKKQEKQSFCSTQTPLP